MVGLQAEDGEVEGLPHGGQSGIVEVAELLLVDGAARVCDCLLAAETTLESGVFEDGDQSVGVVALGLELGTGEGAVVLGLEEEEEGCCAPEGEEGEGGGEEEDGEQPGALLLEPLESLVQQIHAGPIHT